MHNMIFVSIGMVVLGILVATSNMDRLDKIKSAIMMVVFCIVIGFAITPDAFWLIPCVFAGTWLGKWVISSTNKRRQKCLMQAMKEDKAV